MVHILPSKQWLFVLTMVVSATLMARGASPKSQQSQESEREADLLINPKEPPQPRWELLECPHVVNDPISSRRIKHIKIKLLAKQNDPWGRGLAGDKDLVYETTAPSVLEAFEAFLKRPLRMAVQPGLHGAMGDGSSISVGTIEVQTDKDTFTIHVSIVGFVLDSDTADLQNTFYSWGMAHFLDSLCAKLRGTHIPPEVMKKLSGEARIEEDQIKSKGLKEKDIFVESEKSPPKTDKRQK
jgi:hypothetical protein